MIRVTIQMPYLLKKKYLIPDWPAPSNISCCTTLRIGGHSSPPYGHFNLGAHVGDDITQVNKNRQQLMQDWQLKHTPVWLQQTHSDVVVDLDQAQPNLIADASFTRQTNKTCVVMTADCLPILLCDRHGSTIAAIHAGWRGLLAGIISRTVSAMPVAPKQLMVWLGPAIGPDAFIVNQEIKNNFCRTNQRNEQAFTTMGNNIHADLYSLAKIELNSCGITAIHGGRYCTFKQENDFYSYRRANITGRMATLITIKTESRDMAAITGR
jgi:polyphenol oxidase